MVKDGGIGWWYGMVERDGFDMVVGMLVWKVGIEDGM